MRIAIEPIAAPIGLPQEYPDEWKAVPDSFLPALVAAKRFIGQTASYRIEGHVAFLHHGKFYATNNQVAVNRLAKLTPYRRPELTPLCSVEIGA